MAVLQETLPGYGAIMTCTAFWHYHRFLFRLSFCKILNGLCDSIDLLWILFLRADNRKQRFFVNS